MIFKYGKNYSYIFFIFFIPSCASLFLGFTPKITLYLMTLMELFLLISQLRSGVALNLFNESWIAEYEKGTFAYKLSIGLNLLSVLLLSFSSIIPLFF